MPVPTLVDIAASATAAFFKTLGIRKLDSAFIPQSLFYEIEKHAECLNDDGRYILHPQEYERIGHGGCVVLSWPYHIECDTSDPRTFIKNDDLPCFKRYVLQRGGLSLKETYDSCLAAASSSLNILQLLGTRRFGCIVRWWVATGQLSLEDTTTASIVGQYLTTANDGDHYHYQHDHDTNNVATTSFCLCYSYAVLINSVSLFHYLRTTLQCPLPHLHTLIVSASEYDSSDVLVYMLGMDDEIFCTWDDVLSVAGPNCLKIVIDTLYPNGGDLLAYERLEDSSDDDDDDNK